MLKLAWAMAVLMGLACARKLPDWYDHQDRTIQMPPFDGTTKVDLVIDGATLQALRIAAEDFLPSSGGTRACAETQVALRYEVSRRGEIIFIHIGADPHACGGQGYSLGGTARYAISTDGRILRRVLDGEGENAEPDGAGATFEVLSLKPDGGMPVLNPPPFPMGPYAPLWMLDAGIRQSDGGDVALDGGYSLSTLVTSTEEDGGVSNAIGASESQNVAAQPGDNTHSRPPRTSGLDAGTPKPPEPTREKKPRAKGRSGGDSTKPPAENARP